MKVKFKHSLRRTVAFVCALTILSSAALVSAFAERKDEKAETAGEVVQHVDDYTNLFPGLTDTKMKLSDPKFTEKDWYEYIEYEFYADVEDGDITYRIYQPTDYGAASIMAITDYNPKEALVGTSSITMNLGELQGILDIAAQGGNISKEYAGLNLATGIATQMNGINDVMDNSRYYSSSSFLGIPGDNKYTGVSNDGFFNTDSLTIKISASETVSACKTVALSSDYNISESDVSSKDFSTYKEASEAKSNTHEESVSHEHTHSSGSSISDGTSTSEEISESLLQAVENEITNSQTIKVGSSIGSEIGTEGGVSGIVAKITANVTASEEIGTVVGRKDSQQMQTGKTKASVSEHSSSTSEEDSDSDGTAISDSSTFESALTNGTNSSTGQQHAKDMSVGVGYGVDYQYGNQVTNEVDIERTFNARTDKEVKNVGWKLCEYVVKIPYYIEAVKTDSSGNEKVLYGQYVNYNLLNGVSRIFANGYIEHWYTGELVTYADFFNGFITATELVDMAQEQQKAKLPEEAK